MKFIKELTPEEVETAWGPNKPEDYHYIMQGLGNGPVINAAFILSPAVSIADISESGDETTINYSRPNVSGNNQKINGTIRFKKGDNGLPLFASEESEGVSISCSNEYEFSDNMLSGIRSTQTEKNADGQSLTKKLTKIEYARIPHEEFLISKFGFPEPPTQSGNSRWFWWLGVLAVGVVIYFAGRSMSTRQKK